MDRWRSHVFTFVDPLPKKFVLEIVGRPAEHLLGCPVTIAIGGCSCQIKMRSLKIETYRITLTNYRHEKTLKIFIPDCGSPAEWTKDPFADSRKLGVALSSMRISKDSISSRFFPFRLR
jgi:hypothetical protein